tara:strand:- start:34830 stop:35066 length:237 start_codon:yes stop_codon:yes gene_type:complete
MLDYTLHELEALHEQRLEALLDYVGGYMHLARMLNIPATTVKSWKDRGRISKVGAKKVEENKRLRNTIFVAEYLRPEM